MVSKALLSIFTQYGCPEKLQSDNGGEFVSHVLEELCSSLKIRIFHGRPYHPQSQGKVERLNKKIRRNLRYWLLDFSPEEQSTVWPFLLPEIPFILNNSWHSLCYSFWSFLWKLQHCRHSMAFRWIYGFYIVTKFHCIVFNCLCCFSCFMAPIIVSSLIHYAPGIFLSDLCVCIKSHDLYHVWESPLNLCWWKSISASQLLATLERTH